MQLAKRYPQCEVHAFDPSPVSVGFMKGDSELAKQLRKLPNYHFHPYGAGGTDGIVSSSIYASVTRFQCRVGASAVRL